MKSNKKRAVSCLALCLCMALAPVDADALEYEFTGNAPGTTFYQATSLDTDYIAENGDITVGTDGTISTGVTGNSVSGPLSGVSMPVGEYPDAWGVETDIAIAQTSIFPNELGPTAQTTAIYIPQYLPAAITSGALPTGYSLLGTGLAFAPAYNVSAYAPWTLAGIDSSAILPAYITGAGNYFGTALAAQSLPRLTKGGAVAKLKIPSVGLTKYVYDGTTTANMNKGIAHFECTPGWGGNIALAGHNRGNGVAHFYYLKDVKLGDTVIYETALGTRTYAVSSIDTVSVTDVSGLLQDGTQKITMYTCKANQPEVKLKVVATLVG